MQFATLSAAPPRAPVEPPTTLIPGLTAEAEQQLSRSLTRLRTDVAVLLASAPEHARPAILRLIAEAFTDASDIVQAARAHEALRTGARRRRLASRLAPFGVTLAVVELG